MLTTVDSSVPWKCGHFAVDGTTVLRSGNGFVDLKKHRRGDPMNAVVLTVPKDGGLPPLSEVIEKFIEGCGLEGDSEVSYKILERADVKPGNPEMIESLAQSLVLAGESGAKRASLQRTKLLVPTTSWDSIQKEALSSPFKLSVDGITCKDLSIQDFPLAIFEGARPIVEVIISRFGLFGRWYTNELDSWAYPGFSEALTRQLLWLLYENEFFVCEEAVKQVLSNTGLSPFSIHAQVFSEGKETDCWFRSAEALTHFLFKESCGYPHRLAAVAALAHFLRMNYPVALQTIELILRDYPLDRFFEGIAPKDVLIGVSGIGCYSENDRRIALLQAKLTQNLFVKRFMGEG